MKFKEGLYLYDHGKKCYGYMGNKKSVTEIIIPEGVTYINEKAFTGLKNLERIRIPDSVTSIGDYAFSKCEKLNDVRLPGSIVNFKPGKCPFEVKYERVKELNKLAVMSFLEDLIKEPGCKYLKITGIGADCCELELVYKKVTLWKGLFKTVELQSQVGEIKEVASNFKQLYEKTAT